MRIRLFIDYWNFQLHWNDRANKARCDWKRLSSILVQEAQSRLTTAGLGQLQLEETRVYASYEPGRENKLRSWLNNFLDRQPGIRVFTTERHWRKKPIHCRSCSVTLTSCPKCQADLGRASEKAIDALLVTDLINLAWENSYDVALLVSADRDFIPAVDLLQRKNFKVINAKWSHRGHDLAKVCWASFEMDPLIPSLTI